MSQRPTVPSPTAAPQGASSPGSREESHGLFPFRSKRQSLAQVAPQLKDLSLHARQQKLKSWFSHFQGYDWVFKPDFVLRSFMWKKIKISALTGLVQRLGCCPANRKVTGWFSGRGTCLSCGRARGNRDWRFPPTSKFLFVPPFPSLLRSVTFTVSLTFWLWLWLCQHLIF